jgi:hypothetical protein
VATLHLTQSVPATPASRQGPMPIPLRVALFDRATGSIMASNWWC